jgi:hypothetical protein
MTDQPLVLRISISPDTLRSLNRGEVVSWVGVAHPGLTIELAPLAAAPVPVPTPAMNATKGA